MLIFKSCRLGLINIVLGMMLSLAAMAQTITGTISGTVIDASGSVIPNATVTIINEKTGVLRSLATNEEGRFNFAAVQPDVYTVKVERQGFQTYERKNTVLSANENLTLGNLALSVGEVSETIITVAEGAKVETESSDLTARLTADQIALISTKGRDVTSLLRLIPGTSNDDDIESVGEGFGTNLPNISGQRGRSTVATVDGLNASEPSGSNKISMSINQDAVGEVKVLRNNYAAEYGNNGGAIINIVSKGGTKDYKGTAYYFIRNEALNASPFFTNKAGLPKPLYRHNIWGFNYGGPMPLPKFGESGPTLLKNKAFFFFSLEKPHTITPTNPVFVTVPTTLERQGNFSQSFNSSGQLISVIDPLTGVQFPGNIIPQSRWNSNGLALLNIFPLPNAPGGRTAGGAAYNYVKQQSVSVPKHSYLVRFDVQPSNKDSIYWKAQWWTSDNVGLGTSGWPSGDANRWGINSHYLYTDNGWSANWVHILSPSMVNEFNFGMRHDTEAFVPAEGEIERFSRAVVGYTAPQLFPQNNHLGAIPRVTNWSSVSGTPANINWLDRWGEAGQDYIRPSFSDNLSITKGNHSYKFGAYFERLLNSEAPGGNWTGTFSFSTSTSSGFIVSTPTNLGTGNTNYAYANALLGNFNSYSEANSRPFTNLELKLFQWYGQDEWKVKKNFTLNYGVRFGYHSPFFQVDEQGSNFDPRLYDPAKAPLLYVAYCKGQPNGIPVFGTSCLTSNQFAVDPRIIAAGTVPTSSQLLNRNLVRSFIAGTGDLNNGLAIGTDPNTPKGYRRTRPVDVEPRLGFAWDIFGRGKTVLRGMGGVYHSPRVGGGTTGGNLVNNPPVQRTFTINNGNIENLSNLVGTAINFPTSLNALEVNSHTPTTYNFSLGVQQDIGFGTVLEASYVGSLARHLGERRNINQVPDAARFVDCTVAAQFGVPCHPENRDPFSSNSAKNNDFLRPYRGYGDINMVMWSGTSNYNALQVQVNRRYARGFQYGVAYTWSKTFDYANDDSSDVNNGRPYRAFNYAVANFDQTHILTVNYIWDVPMFLRANNRLVRGVLGGWLISGTTSYASGKPKDLTFTYTSGTATISKGQICPAGSIQSSVNATTGDITCTALTDFTGGTINGNPNVIGNPNRRPGTSDPTGTPYVIDPAAFVAPTRLGDIGNLPRNAVRLPSTFNTDLAFFKNFRISESRGIQLRWETYNLFNRTNFTDIDGAMTFGLVSITKADGTKTAVIQQTNTRFGAPINARSPRVMQGSLRINF